MRQQCTYRPLPQLIQSLEGLFNLSHDTHSRNPVKQYLNHLNDAPLNLGISSRKFTDYIAPLSAHSLDSSRYDFLICISELWNIIIQSVFPAGL